MAEPPYKYWAFISYSHQDRAWASWLHKALETYRVPTRLVGREHWSGIVPRRLLPIFRDRDELSSSAELGTVLNEALRQSRHLVVICSPQSANSRWVNEEIKTFKAMGRSAHVLPIIVSGEPDVSHIAGKTELECLPSALRFEVDSNGELTDRRAEPIAADARGGQDGRRNARLKLIAGLIGVGLDELKQRERQRTILQRVMATAAVVALTFSAAAGWRWQQHEKQAALDAQELKVRIEQVYEKGRQELLAHNEARAAVYLNEAYKLGVDTPALRYMLARAMRVVDAQVLRVQIGVPVIHVRFAPDGKHFLVVDRNYQLSVWDAERGIRLGTHALGETTQAFYAQFSPKGEMLWIITDHSDEPRRRLSILSADAQRELAQFSTDPAVIDLAPIPFDESARHLAYIAPDQSIVVHSLQTGQSRRIPGPYSVVTFCSDRGSLIAGTTAGSVTLLDRATGQVQRHFRGLRGAVASVAFNQDCSILAAGTAEGAVRVWQVGSGEVLMTGGHRQPIVALRMNPQGTRLMSRTDSGINIWDGQTGVLLYAGKLADPLNSLATMSPDGERVASINDARLALLDPLNAAELYTLDGHQGAALYFDFSASAQHFISGGADGTVVIWQRPRDAEAEFRLGAASDRGLMAETFPPDAQVQFDPAGRHMAMGGADGLGLILNDAAQTLIALEPHQAPLSAMAYSADGAKLATGGWEGAVKLWDTASGALLAQVDGLGEQVRSVAISPSGDFFSVAVVGLGTTLRGLPSGEQLQHFATDSSRANAFHPTQPAFAVAVQGVVQRWDLPQRRLRWSRPLANDDGGEPQITIVKFSPDGKQILVTEAARRAYVLDSESGLVLQAIEEPSAAGLFTAAFSPDGRRIALGDYGKSVLLWNLDLQSIRKLLGHTAEIRAVSFGADGALLVSAAADGALKVWDADSGVLLDSITAHDGPVSWDGAQFNVQGDRVLSGGADNIARLWKLQKEGRNPEQIAALLRCRVAWKASGSVLESSLPETQGCAKP